MLYRIVTRISRVQSLNRNYEIPQDAHPAMFLDEEIIACDLQIKSWSVKMKRFASLVIVGLLVLGSSFQVHASTTLSYVDGILALQPDVSLQEFEQQVKEISLTTGMDEEAIYKQMYSEMEKQNLMGKREAVALAKQQSINGEVGTLGGAEGDYIIGTSSQGNFYYTPSATAYLDHGHVGLYYSSSVIVESIPSTGVRQISATVRTVDKGAVVKSVSTTSTNKSGAANWAYGEIGQPYSYNFANNRNTGHSGAKNCSKLVWSAYMLHGGLDLDVDKGFGVYPRDVRDASQTQLVRSI